MHTLQTQVGATQVLSLLAVRIDVCAMMPWLDPNLANLCRTVTAFVAELPKSSRGRIRVCWQITLGTVFIAITDVHQAHANLHYSLPGDSAKFNYHVILLLCCALLVPNKCAPISYCSVEKRQPRLASSDICLCDLSQALQR